ncbi:MAG: DUF6531 domain-containing protein, partial [Verrucomicrobiales bacterium]|nr:DUF6531 domain-containing protein [Verrucomicrobiales bacterium]
MSTRVIVLWFNMAALTMTPILAGVIPPDTVRRDVFGARFTEVAVVNIPAGGQELRLKFGGFVGLNYALQVSSNLVDWVALGSVTAAGGNSTYQELFSAESQRFYRAAFAGSGDRTPPTWPSDAKMTAAVFDSEGVDIDLHLASDDAGVLAYALYQDGQHRATLAPTELNAFIGGLEPNTVYEFDVVACDGGGNCTQLPESLTVRTRIQQEPFLNAPRHESTFLSSGEFSITRADLAIPARELGFHFTRTYRSDVELSGPLGYGWSANVFERLRERSNGDVVWLQGDGRVDVFVKQPASDYSAPTGVFMTLSKGVSGFRLINASGTVHEFDLGGRILSITTRNGNRLAFQRTGGQLTSVTDDMGRATVFGYDALGRLESLKDFTGREVRYSYDPDGNLTSARSPLVTGTPNTNDFPTGKTERYVYDSGNADPDLAHNLVRIIAPNEVAHGSLTPREVITYGSGGLLHDRVLTHTIGGTNDSGVPAGGTISYWTNPLSDPAGSGLERNTVRDRRGHEVHYDFDANGHLTRKTEVLTDRLDPVTTYTYDAEGNLLSVTHPEGNATNYAYDSAHRSRRSQGNLLSVARTPGPRGADQAQLVSRFTYEPIFNHVHTSTDPRGNTFSNTFDFEEACDFAAIGAKIGLRAADAQAMLNSDGLCLAPLGDLNNDGATSQASGNVLRRAHPIVTLDAASYQAALEGGTSQVVEEFFQFNSFGQLTAHLDAEKNRHTRTYFTERDPNGDSVIDNPGGHAATGGYLAMTVIDSAAGAQRNSGGNPPIAAITTTYRYNERGTPVLKRDPRGVATRFIVNALDQVVKTVSAADVDPAHPNADPEPVPPTPFSYDTQIFYDANNNVVQLDVEDGDDTSNTGGMITTTWQHDILNQPLSVTEEIDVATTRTTRYRYDAAGNVSLVVKPEGNADSWTYDERNLVVQSTTGATNAPAETLGAVPGLYSPGGGTPSTVTHSWSDNGNLASITDAADTDGSAANNGPSAGDLTQHRYDGYDRRIESVDPAGNRATVSYDANGNRTLTRRHGPNGGPTPASNLASSNLLSETAFTYDSLNRLIRSARKLFANTVPGADIEEGAADIGKGNLVPGDGAVNRLFEYDRLGRPTFVVEDDGDTHRFTYDGAGRRLSATDPLGNKTETAWCDTGKPVEIRRTDVSTKVGVSNEVFLTTFIYDALTRRTTEVNNLGHTRRFQYDSRDNVVAISDANGPAAGLTIRRRAFPDSPTTVNARNDHGNVTRYTYDGRNRLTRTDRVLTANGFGNGTLNPTPDTTQDGGDGLITTRTVYDKNDRVSARLDDNLFRTSYSYDNLNRLTMHINGACAGGILAGYTCQPATSNRFNYDANHNLIQKTDEAGNAFTHTFDALNRKTQTAIKRASGMGGVTQQRFEYDGLGRCTTSFDDHSNATVEFAYDSLSRVVRETLVLPGAGRFTNDIAWRAENLRSGLTYPNGTKLSYRYDASDRVAQIADTVGPVANYDYIGHRLLEERFPNGARNSHVNGYDGVGRPVQLETRDASGNVVVSFDYTWDRTANRLSEAKNHNPANSEVYRYDSAYRLAQFTRPGLAAAPPLHSSWRFDGTGNWREVDGAARNTTSFNEILSIAPSVGSPVSLSSDDNGNLTRDPTAPAGQITRQFDAFNRLISASIAGGPTLTYTYDAFSRRLSEDDGAHHKVAFLHDGKNVVADWDVTGDQIGTPGTPGMLREFVSSAICNDGSPGVYYFGGDSKRPARLKNAAGAQFNYHFNSLGSVVALTPSTGAGAELVRYQAYGTPTVTQTGGLAPTGNPYLFTGRRRCFATGNYYDRARYYDANLGRFLSRDPIGAWGDAGNHGNAYAYANNNPINRTDPSGRLALENGGLEMEDEAPMFGDDWFGSTVEPNADLPMAGFRGAWQDDWLAPVSRGSRTRSPARVLSDQGSGTLEQTAPTLLGTLRHAASISLNEDVVFAKEAQKSFGHSMGGMVLYFGHSQGGISAFWNFTTGHGEVAYQQVYGSYFGGADKL